MPSRRTYYHTKPPDAACLASLQRRAWHASEQPSPQSTTGTIPPLPRRVAALALLLCAAAPVAGLPVVAAQDADNDGVSDGADAACPGSSRSARRDHVDAHGCEWDQIDADRDGWCNPADRPRDANNKWLETRDEWSRCMGIDNCKLVYNPDQTQNLTADAPSDRDGHGDACNTSEWPLFAQHSSTARVQYYSTVVLYCTVSALLLVALSLADGCHAACALGCDHQCPLATTSVRARSVPAGGWAVWRGLLPPRERVGLRVRG
jgi:hypothetical protein